jgi:kanamycin nucleotidyltransferase
MVIDMKTTIYGPQPYTHEERMARAHAIADQFRAKFAVLAIGLYGSLARGSDGPFSDIEMYCIVPGEGVDTSYEWSGGPWKAEVNVQSLDVLTAWAAEFDEFWPLTHGSCVNILPLYDPQNLFAALKEQVFDHNDAGFDELIAGIIVGELYEFLGKMRNAAASGKTENLPALAVEMAKYGAYLIGLANRTLYTSSSSLFSESLTLAEQPDGYQPLCCLVMAGRLSNAAEIVAAADHFWDGIERWAAQKSMPIHHDLADLLDDDVGQN